MSRITVKVVQANISYGGHGTDNVLNLNRTTDYLIKLSPDFAALTEVIGGDNDPVLITNLMNRKTGGTWYNYYAPKYAGCGEGVMVLSKWPISSKATCFMSYQMPIAQTTIDVGGKPVNFFATHFQWPKNDSGQRQVEAKELVSFAAKFAEPRIIGGDLNAQIGTPELNIIIQNYIGGWDQAVTNKTAVSYPDNPPSLNTRTRRSRIDHVLYSRNAGSITVPGARIPDQRVPGTASKVTIKIGTADDNGVRPSDHNFLSVTLTIP